MSNPWHSLLLKTDDSEAVSEALLTAFSASSYTRYNPFPGGSGTPPKLKMFIKHFVAPAQDGWTRILGDPDPAVLLTLNQSIPLLHGWLDDSGGSWQLIADGTVTDDPLAFSPYLKPGKTLDDLRRAQLGHAPVATVETDGLLPPDVQQLANARNVNPKQADKLMERVTSRLFGRLDKTSEGEASSMKNQARAMISGSGGPDWNSTTGRAVRAAADMMALPANWREPAWSDVRDAYQAARMLARNPKASLLPNERDALKTIPDAGQYIAVYVGKP